MDSGLSQFDWDAFMGDTLEASVAATGAWIRCLYKMRKSVTRGRICLPLTSYARLFGTSQEQAQAIITEIGDLGIGDAESGDGGKITLTNRRLYREGKEGDAQPTPQSKQIEQFNGSNSTISYSSSSTTNHFNKEEKSKNKSFTKPDVVRVFTYWQTTLNHPKALLTTGRETTIRARLKEGYSTESLERAIDGCKNSAWHMGDNPEGKVYDGISLIFRDGEHVERFQGYLRTVRKPVAVGQWDGEEKPVEIVACSRCGSDTCLGGVGCDQRAEQRQAA